MKMQEVRETYSYRPAEDMDNLTQMADAPAKPASRYPSRDNCNKRGPKATHSEMMGYNVAHFDEVAVAKAESDTPAAPKRRESFIDEQQEIRHLIEKGYSIHHVSELVYNHMRRYGLPNFLERLQLDPDGGLDRIQDMWTNIKIPYCFLLVFSIWYNVTFLVMANWAVFQGVVLEARHMGQQSLKEAESGQPWWNVTLEGDDEVIGSMDDNIFAIIANPSRRHKIVIMACVVSTCEIIGMMLAILLCLVCLMKFMLKSSEYHAYHNLVDLTQDHLRDLSTFSALGLVAYVHPALLYEKYLDMLNNSVIGTNQWGTAVTTVYFMVTRGFCALFAIQAFAVKMVSCALRLTHHKYSFANCLFAVMGLMNQTIGCVTISKVLQDRLFLFIFGGSDTEYVLGELAYRNVYQCRVAKEIWEKYWRKGERFKALVLLCTYDHHDLQRLIIDDEALSAYHTQKKRDGLTDRYAQLKGREDSGES